MLKMISIGSASSSRSKREKAISASPSRQSTAPMNQVRPRSPQRMPKRSEKTPPSERAKRFISPKIEAIAPASTTDSPNVSWK